VNENNQKAVLRFETPTLSKIDSSDQEFCFYLPFHRQLNSLAYIGVNRNETWYVPAHYHNHFEICYISQGQGWFTAGDKFYPVEEGALFLTKPGDIHQGAASGDRPYTLCYLGFTLAHMRHLEAEFYSLTAHTIDASRNPAAGQLFNAMLSEIQSDDDWNDYMVESMMSQFLITILRQYKQHDANDGSALSLKPEIRKVMNLIHQHAVMRLNVDELAQAVYWSRTHLDRQFKRALGVSLGEYIRKICCDRAKYWLRETAEPITEIAEKLHFHSIHQFSMFFKRYTGMSPRQYREEDRTAVQYVQKR